MAEFILLLHEYPQTSNSLSPEDIQQIIQKYKDWGEKLRSRGKLVASAKLTDDGGRMIATNNGRVTVTDGPYVETKEIIGGFFQIQARDYAEAAGLVEDCPHLSYGGRIELRQIHEV